MPTINAPQANTEADAFAGRICACYGTAVSPETFLEFQCILIWGSGPLSAPTGPDVTLTAMDGVSLDGQNANWNASGLVPCSMGGPAGSNSNVSAQALWTDWTNVDPNGNPTGVAVPLNPFAVNFRGIEQPSCGGPAAMVVPKVSSLRKSLIRNLAASASADSVDIEPTGIDGRFLRYDQLQVAVAASATMGYRLTSNGVPVRASQIRIAAERVEYYYGRTERNYVTRPAGPTLVSSNAIAGPRPAFLSTQLPVWSIMISQPGSSQRQVLVSNDAGHPDVIRLNPDKDIFVQVNHDWRFLSTLGGSFGLLLDWN